MNLFESALASVKLIRSVADEQLDRKERENVTRTASKITGVTRSSIKSKETAIKSRHLFFCDRGNGDRTGRDFRNS